jgi:hypothetical protein
VLKPPVVRSSASSRASARLRAMVVRVRRPRSSNSDKSRLALERPASAAAAARSSSASRSESVTNLPITSSFTNRDAGCLNGRGRLWPQLAAKSELGKHVAAALDPAYPIIVDGDEKRHVDEFPGRTGLRAVRDQSTAAVSEPFASPQKRLGDDDADRLGPGRTGRGRGRQLGEVAAVDGEAADGVPAWVDNPKRRAIRRELGVAW